VRPPVTYILQLRVKKPANARGVGMDAPEDHADSDRKISVEFKNS
jgi:hypothetical protein